MSRLRTLFTKPFPQCLAVFPGGPVLIPLFYICGGVVIHYLFIRALITGEIRGRYSTGWMEARDSSPGLYWFYIAAFGLAVALIDGFLVYSLLRARRR